VSKDAKRSGRAEGKMDISFGHTSRGQFYFYDIKKRITVTLRDVYPWNGS